MDPFTAFKPLEMSEISRENLGRVSDDLRSMLNSEQFDEAIALAESYKPVALSHDEAAYWYYFGAALYNQQKYWSAFFRFVTSAQLSTNSHGRNLALFFAAKCSYKMHDYSVVDRLLHLFPEEHFLFNEAAGLHGNALYKLGRFGEAAIQFRRGFLATHVDDKQMRTDQAFNTALAYFHSNQKESAIDFLREVFALNPMHEEALKLKKQVESRP